MIDTRDHAMLGITQSLCPECRELVPAKIIVRDGRVYFRKRCTKHGVREDYVCSDPASYSAGEYGLPGKLPRGFGTEPDRGCPYDCGLCSEHEQHTCIGLVELTSSCNLMCPMCYAASAPGGRHLDVTECRRAIDRLVEAEGRPEVLQLSGGEPTIHPEFLAVLDYAIEQPIDVVMINSNGLRFARDWDLVRAVADRGPRVEVYLQFDGFRADTSVRLRGESLVDAKLAAVENLGRAGVRVTLVVTLQPGVNLDEVGDIVRYGIERPWVTGVSFQPATYSGRHVLPNELESRVTFPDVIQAIADQTNGMFGADDFMPLPCAHPNCHSISYAYRSATGVLPLMRIVNAREHPDLLAGGIMFTRPRARQLVERYLERVACCGGQCGPVSITDLSADPKHHARDSSDERSQTLGTGVDDSREPAEAFYRHALSEQLTTGDVFRISITSFLDVYNFDVRRLMRCCIHHVLPSGHIVPFCAYNVLYRDGHVKLPMLTNTPQLVPG